MAVHSAPGQAPSAVPQDAAADLEGNASSTPGRAGLSGTPVRTAAELPDRRYFRIGEVAVLLGVKPYVLRYWETEFPQVRPQKSRSGQRLYRRREVEILLDIRHLLYERGFTIAGARKALKEIEERPELARNLSSIPLTELPSQVPVPASVQTLAPPPLPLEHALMESQTPHAELPSLTPQRAEQLTLALAQVETAMLEEVRDGIRDLLSLCREN